MNQDRGLFAYRIPLSVFAFFVLSFFLGYYQNPTIFYSSEGEIDSHEEISLCGNLDKSAPFPYIRLTALAFQIKKTGVEIEADIPLIQTPLFEMGFEYEFPTAQTSPNFLYIVIRNQGWDVEKATKIYCLDLREQSVKVLINDQYFKMADLVVSKTGLVLENNRYKFVSYYQHDDRMVLEVDASRGDLRELQFIPASSVESKGWVTGLPPEYYCQRFKNDTTIHPLRVILVCVGDGTNIMTDGLLHLLTSRADRNIGWLLRILCDVIVLVGVFITLTRIVTNCTKDNFWAFWDLFLFVVWFVWLVLTFFKIIPYIFL